MPYPKLYAQTLLEFIHNYDAKKGFLRKKKGDHPAIAEARKILEDISNENKNSPRYLTDEEFLKVVNCFVKMENRVKVGHASYDTFNSILNALLEPPQPPHKNLPDSLYLKVPAEGLTQEILTEFINSRPRQNSVVSASSSSSSANPANAAGMFATPPPVPPETAKPERTSSSAPDPLTAEKSRGKGKGRKK